MDWKTQVAAWVAQGKVWKANETTLAAVVTAVPTTTAGISLWNGDEAKLNRSYLVLAVYAIQGGTPAALSSWGLVHQLSDLATGTTQPAAGALLDTSTVVVGVRGSQGVYGGAAVIDIGETVLDDRWAPIGDSADTVVISLTGSQVYVPLYPPVEIPPGALYSLMGVGAAVDITLRKGIVWAELEQDELDALGL